MFFIWKNQVQKKYGKRLYKLVKEILGVVISAQHSKKYTEILESRPLTWKLRQAEEAYLSITPTEFIASYKNFIQYILIRG